MQMFLVDVTLVYVHVFGLPGEWHNYVLNIVKGISHEIHERKPSTPEGSKMKDEMGA